MTNDEFVSTVCPIIGVCGAAFYFAPSTLAIGADLGLDGVGFYVMGRGGVLGDVESRVVSAAFGYFNPALVAGAWAGGRAVVDPRSTGHAYHEACAAFGRLKLAGLADLDQFVSSAEAVNAAADPTGLALYAAVSAEPLATDAPARAMQLLAFLREFRGSAHLVALRSAGISTKDAHFVKRPSDVTMFGWSASDAPEIDDALLAKMGEAEALTDRLVAPAFAVIDDSGRANFLDGLRAISEAISS